MIRKKWSRITHSYIYHKCYCTKTLPNPRQQNVAEIVENPDNIPRPTANSNTHRSRIYNFFTDPKFNTVKMYIPRKYFQKSIKPLGPNDLYLICPEASKRIANIILKDLDIPHRNDYVVCNENPGIGMISQELLDGGLKSIRLYEGCADFRVNLHDFVKLYKGRVKLFHKELFNLSSYTYVDRFDGGHRVDDMLVDIPRKDWLDDPALIIVGVLGSLSFIKYLIRSLALQIGLMTLGRVQMYALLRPQDLLVFRAHHTDKLSRFKALSVLFQSFFDIEVLETLPRNLFLPWLQKEFGDVFNCVYGELNLENMFLVKITSKKFLPIEFDKLMSFYYFILQTYAKNGNHLLIPTLEKWIAGIGESLISSNLDNRYPEDFGVFTKIREINVQQITAVFNEAINHPNFHNSIFDRLMEQEQIRTITTDTDLHDALELKATKMNSDIENK